MSEKQRNLQTQSGILVTDKPPDWTSMDVCAKLRGVLGVRRIGHGGTLDPMATGVLPVFVGRATRAVEYAVSGKKEYIAGLTLGLVTNTQDSTGEVLERYPVQVTRETLVHQILPAFTGELSQIPPMYSAVKIHGKKLYELARAGKEIERQPRSIQIFELELLDFHEQEHQALLRIVCSPGTYIRTLCHDIGQTLGCGGIMHSLRRTYAAGFSLEEAVTLEDVITRVQNHQNILLPVDRFFLKIGWQEEYTVSENAERILRNGGEARISHAPERCRVYTQHREFLGLGAQKENGRFRLVRSFYEV